MSLVVSLGLLTFGISGSTVQAGVGARTLSFPFLANAVELSERVSYYAPTPGGALYVTREGVLVYALSGPKRDDVTGSEVESPGWVLTETPLGGTAKPAAGKAARTRLSYFRGNDPERWQHGVRTYETVRLGDVWPGIAVELAAYAGTVEKRLVLAPKTDPDVIRFRLGGAQALRLNTAGDMEVQTGSGAVTFTAPVAWQDSVEGRLPVEAAYVLREGASYGFALGEHDPALPVTIDPIIQTTYLGGSGIEYGWGIAVHPTTGTVYVVGETRSDNFPGTLGGAQSSIGGGEKDAFVGRLDSELSGLEQATYLGGTMVDVGLALTLDPTGGTVFVTGFTDSADFPGTTGGAQSGLMGDYDVFIARLNAELTVLEQATYVGGAVPPNYVGAKAHDSGSALALHPGNGDLYVAGTTRSQDFPGTTGSAQPNWVSYGEAFVARLTPGLTSLTRATYLGGQGDDSGHAILIDPDSSEVYVAGITGYVPYVGITEGDLPGASGGAQADFGGMVDGFVAHLSADLSTLEQATYMGGSSMEELRALHLGAGGGTLYAAGYTASEDLPGTAGGAQPTLGNPATVGTRDAFLAQLSTDLTVLHQSTYLGGRANERAYGLDLNPLSGEIYVAGTTESYDFPGATCGLQWRPADSFVARLAADLTSLSQSTFLGGTYSSCYGMTLDPATGDVYLTGETSYDDFPGTAGGAQETSGGSVDAFAALLSADLLLPVVTDPSLDIDGNGEQDALSDGILILRYLFEFRGDPLIDGAVACGTRCTAIEIEDYLELERCSGIFDVDGNGEQDALSDGILILRYLFEFRGDPLIDGAVATDCTRCTAAAIEAYIAGL